MNCQQIDEYLFAYCDEKLSPELRSLIDEHLDSCETCQNMVRMAKMESQILADTTDIPLLSEDFTSQVMHSIFDQPSTPAGASSAGLLARLSQYRLYIGGTAAAAVILLVLYLPGFIPLNTNLDSSKLADRSITGESAPEQVADIPLPDVKTLETDYGNSASVVQDDCLADKISTPTPPASSADNTAEEKQKLSSEIDNSKDSHTTSAVKQNDQYYTLTLPEGSELIDQDLNESELDLLSLSPSNLPTEYRLEKIINTSYNAITYVYSNTVNNDALEITVALAYNADITQQSLAGRSGEGTDQKYVRSGDALLNTANTSISYQGHSFEINLKAAMPLDKLQELANSIKFQEALPDELID